MLNYVFKNAKSEIRALLIITGLMELHSICSPWAYKIVIRPCIQSNDLKPKQPI